MDNPDNPFAEYFETAGPKHPYTLATANDGTQLVLVCFPKSFLSFPENAVEPNQLFLQEEFQKCASSQGIKGNVIILWQLDGDRLGHLLPTNTAVLQLLRTLTPKYLATHVSGQITFLP